MKKSCDGSTVVSIFTKRTSFLLADESFFPEDDFTILLLLHAVKNIPVINDKKIVRMIGLFEDKYKETIRHNIFPLTNG